MMASKANPANQRGSAAPKVVAAIVVIALIAAAIVWFATRSDDTTPSVARPAAPGSAAPTGPAEPAPLISPAIEELSIDQLYREARKALAEWLATHAVQPAEPAPGKATT